MVKLYHCTKKEVAESILREGFRDGSGTYLTHHERCGVWVSDRPLDANEGAWGDTLLEITLAMMTEADFQQFEWIEEGRLPGMAGPCRTAQ